MGQGDDYMHTLMQPAREERRMDIRKVSWSEEGGDMFLTLSKLGNHNTDHDGSGGVWSLHLLTFHSDITHMGRERTIKSDPIPHDHSKTVPFGVSLPHFFKNLRFLFHGPRVTDPFPCIHHCIVAGFIWANV